MLVSFVREKVGKNFKVKTKEVEVFIHENSVLRQPEGLKLPLVKEMPKKHLGLHAFKTFVLRTSNI
jgi:hypothetical protein